MISSDLPIVNSSQDILNRSIFAKRLAETILQDTLADAFTIGLYGKWGSGKTSLVNMILEAVKDTDDNAIVFNFNPWLCSEPKQLISEFLKQMSAAIKLKKGVADQTWELIDRYASLFDIGSLFSGIGPFAAVAGKALAKRAKSKIDARNENLQGTKNRIIERLKNENLKFIVAIDDIDRLSEDEIIAVFQLVKSLADFPNTVYILAFDYDVVVHALSKVQYGNGQDYLEKIVQVPFEIPIPDIEKIHGALFSKLTPILEDVPEEKWDVATWGEIFQYGFQVYIRSMRDIVRFMNVFQLKYGLLKDETDPVDLLGLTCLQVFEPTVYSQLPNYKDLLCGNILQYSHNHQKSEEEAVKQALSAITDNGAVANPEAVKSVLGILFPSIKTGVGMSFMHGRSYNQREFLINSNIAAPECFDRYFALSLETEAIPAWIIKHLIYNANENDFCTEVMRLYREGKIVRLVNTIEAYANKKHSPTVPQDRCALIVKALAQMWDTFEVKEQHILDVPFHWQLGCCIESLLKAMQMSNRFSCIYSIFNDPKTTPATLSRMLLDFEHQLGRFKDDDSSNADALFSLEEVLKLEVIFKQRAIDGIDSGEVLKQNHGLSFLWLLEQIDTELVTAKKRAIVTDDLSLVKVISYATSSGKSVTVRSSTNTRTVHTNILSEFIDIEVAYCRIKNFVEDRRFFSLPQDDQINAIAFILVMEHPGCDKTEIENCVSENYAMKELERLNSLHQYQ